MQQQETLGAVEAVALVRQIVQIMGRLYVRNNAQMTLRDVAMDDTFTRAETLQLTNADSGTYKRYKLTITRITEDKESYQLSLVPANGCGPSWFTNETGIIFAGDCLPPPAPARGTTAPAAPGRGTTAPAAPGRGTTPAPGRGRTP